MLFGDSKFRYTREQAARALSVPQAVIDILVAQGRLSDPISARALEEFFRDSLLRLYHTEATRAAKIGAPEAPAAPRRPAPTEATARELPRVQPAGDEAPVITRSINEFQATREPERTHMRRAPRYEPRRPVGGTFGDMPFTILQISATGLRIRHEDTIRIGYEARVTFDLGRAAESFALRARVMWTSIAQRGENASFCLSGLRATANTDALLEAIEALRQSRDIQIEGDAGALKKGRPAALVGLSDEDVALIIRAYRSFTSDPTEAAKWYARARFAVSDDAVKKIAPERLRDREEVLGIWEYLERKVDVGAIANVVTWLRQTRSAAAG